MQGRADHAPAPFDGRAAGQHDGALVGRTIAGKFLIECFLGGGAMGAVYKARQLNLEKDVAVKVLHGEHAGDATFVARFQREAKAASRLDHPNSMRVLDFGQEPDGLLYIAMEYLDGRDLFRVIQHEWPLSTLRIADVLSQALAAIAVAHDLGIVHRDLKPENIMVLRGLDDEGTPHDIVKVCDFGIAKFTEQRSTRAEPGQKLTTQGIVVGTPEYMSPEQGKGEALDSRSDIYSVGVSPRDGRGRGWALALLAMVVLGGAGLFVSTRLRSRGMPFAPSGTTQTQASSAPSTLDPPPPATSAPPQLPPLEPLATQQPSPKPGPAKQVTVVASRPPAVPPSAAPPLAAAPAPPAPLSGGAPAASQPLRALEPTAPPSLPPPEAPPAPFDASRARVTWTVANAGGGATTSAVQRALARSSGTWTTCYRAALQRRAERIEGQAVMHLVTDETGNVVGAKIAGFDAMPQVKQCILGSARVHIDGVDTGDAWADVALNFRPE
jgi:serine/threonine protein kinase